MRSKPWLTDIFLQVIKKKICHRNSACVCCILPASIKTNLVSCWSSSRPGGLRNVWGFLSLLGEPGGFTAAIGSSSGMGGSRAVGESGPGGSLGRDDSSSLRASGRTSSATSTLSSLSDLQEDKLHLMLLQSGWVPHMCSNWCHYLDSCSAFWQIAPSRSMCEGLMMAKPVCRITECTLYSLMTVLVPGTWDLRTSKGKSKKNNSTLSVFSTCSWAVNLPYDLQTVCFQGWTKPGPDVAHGTSSYSHLGSPEDKKKQLHKSMYINFYHVRSATWSNNVSLLKVFLRIRWHFHSVGWPFALDLSVGYWLPCYFLLCRWIRSHFQSCIIGMTHRAQISP